MKQQEVDRFAVEFLRYVDGVYYQNPNKNNCFAMCERDFTDGKTYKIKELLKLFKKEIWKP